MRRGFFASSTSYDVIGLPSSFSRDEGVIVVTRCNVRRFYRFSWRRYSILYGFLFSVNSQIMSFVHPISFLNNKHGKRS